MQLLKLQEISGFHTGFVGCSSLVVCEAVLVFTEVLKECF